MKSFPALSKGFEIETEMTIHALDKNFTLVNVPVTYRDRPNGSVSKLSTVSDGIKVIRTIFRLFKNYRPLQFFSLIGLLLVIISLAFFIPVLADFISTGLVARFPTLIVSGFIFLVGLLSFVCGFVLDTVVKKDRQQFEIYLNIIHMLCCNNKYNTDDNPL